MKKLLFAPLLVAYASCHAHNADSVRLIHEQINIYEFGMPVTSCRCNFENLMYNWKKWVINNKETELLSYRYVETLTDAAKITRYATLMFSWEATLFSTWEKSYGSSDKDKTEYKKEIGYVPVTYAEHMKNVSECMAKNADKIKLARKELERELDNLRTTIASEMQFGDEVYLLQFMTKERVYDYYVVCRPANCQTLPSDALRNIKRKWSEIKEL
jgi:hypothetical protein